MRRSSHEFFIDVDSGHHPDVGEVSDPVILSSYFDQQLRERNEAMRDCGVPEEFDIPEHLFVASGLEGRKIGIAGQRTLVFDETKTRYRPFQVQVLNTVLNAVRPISVDGITNRLLLDNKSQAKQYRQAAERVCEKATLTHIGKLLISVEDDAGVSYAVDPTVVFVEQRHASLTPEQSTRQHIIQVLCKTYNNSPDVLRQLQGYAARPLENIPSHWSAGAIASYQLKTFPVLSTQERESLLGELEGLIEAYKFGISTVEDQKRVVAVANQLICAHLRLGRAIVNGAFGIRSAMVPSPATGSLANYHNNSLSRPEDDAYAISELAVTYAVQTYDKNRGSLVTYLANKVGHMVREGVFDLNRHVFGHNLHEIKNNEVQHLRRAFGTVAPGERDESYTLPEPRNFEPHREYEEIVQEVNAGPFVRAVFRSEDLRPAEKLILSLATGIYNEEFEGERLRGASGQQIVYDSGFMKNPIFRDGMTDAELSKMFEVSVSQIARLRLSAYRKVEDIIRNKLATSYSREKWKDWIWSE